MVTVIVFGGKKIKFSKLEIDEMIANIDDYLWADNLPKWLMASGHCKFSEKSVVAKLKEIRNSRKTIDVRY